MEAKMIAFAPVAVVSAVARLWEEIQEWWKLLCVVTVQPKQQEALA